MACLSSDAKLWLAWGWPFTLQLTGGGPDVDVLAAVVAEGLKGGFIAPVALEMEKGDQSLLI